MVSIFFTFALEQNYYSKEGFFWRPQPKLNLKDDIVTDPLPQRQRMSSKVVPKLYSHTLHKKVNLLRKLSRRLSNIKFNRAWQIFIILNGAAC